MDKGTDHFFSFLRRKSGISEQDREDKKSPNHPVFKTGVLALLEEESNVCLCEAQKINSSHQSNGGSHQLYKSLVLYSGTHYSIC